MPSASKSLRDKFPGGDREAFAVLSLNFTEKAGAIWRIVPSYTPSARENEALDYMFHEWDYSYEPRD